MDFQDVYSKITCHDSVPISSQIQGEVIAMEIYSIPYTTLPPLWSRDISHCAWHVLANGTCRCAIFAYASPAEVRTWALVSRIFPSGAQASISQNVQVSELGRSRAF
jgi:hypothetical protein